MTTDARADIFGVASGHELQGVLHILFQQMVGCMLLTNVSHEPGYDSWLQTAKSDLQLPGWLDEVIRSLGTWEGLQGEWASDGPKPVAWGMSALALRVLSEHLPVEGPAPTVGATWDGGYEISWVGHDMFISILLEPLKGVTCSYSDDRHGMKVEEEFAVEGRNKRLEQLLQQFTDHARHAVIVAGR